MGWFGENTEDMDPGDVFEDLEAGLDEHDISVRKAPQLSSGKHTILYAVLAAVGVLVGTLFFYWLYTGQLPGFGPQTALIQNIAVEMHTTNDKPVPTPEEFKTAQLRINGLADTTQELETAPAVAREELNTATPQVESASDATADADTRVVDLTNAAQKHGKTPVQVLKSESDDTSSQADDTQELDTEVADNKTELGQVKKHTASQADDTQETERELADNQTDAVQVPEDLEADNQDLEAATVHTQELETVLAEAPRARETTSEVESPTPASDSSVPEEHDDSIQERDPELTANPTDLDQVQQAADEPTAALTTATQDEAAHVKAPEAALDDAKSAGTASKADGIQEPGGVASVQEETASQADATQEPGRVASVQEAAAKQNETHVKNLEAMRDLEERVAELEVEFLHVETPNDEQLYRKLTDKKRTPLQLELYAAMKNRNLTQDESNTLQKLDNRLGDAFAAAASRQRKVISRISNADAVRIQKLVATMHIRNTALADVTKTVAERKAARDDADKPISALTNATQDAAALVEAPEAALDAAVRRDENAEKELTAAKDDGENHHDTHEQEPKVDQELEKRVSDLVAESTGVKFEKKSTEHKDLWYKVRDLRRELNPDIESTTSDEKKRLNTLLARVNAAWDATLKN
eukprot:910683_1